MGLILDDVFGWTEIGEVTDTHGDLQLSLTWISGRKDFDASVWDSRRGLAMLYHGPLRTIKLIRREVTTVDVTAEFMETLSRVR